MPPLVCEVDMETSQICPKCGETAVLRIRRERIRCRACRYEWVRFLPLEITEEDWQKLIEGFLAEKTLIQLMKETGLHRQRVLRATDWIRRAMAWDTGSGYGQAIVGSLKGMRVRARGTLEMRVPPVLAQCYSHRVSARILPVRAFARPLDYTTLLLAKESYRQFAAVLIDKGQLHYFMEWNRGDRKHSKRVAVEDFGRYFKQRFGRKLRFPVWRFPLHLQEWVWRFEYQYNSVADQTSRIIKVLHHRILWSKQRRGPKRAPEPERDTSFLRQ